MPRLLAARLTLALAAVGLLAVGLWLVWSGPPGLVQDAGACREVTSSQCFPFVQVVYATLGEKSHDVVSIRGRPYCGQDACQQSFGPLVAWLEVTYSDGTKSQYRCIQDTGGLPACEQTTQSK
jgi:hypothetical protein